MQTVITLAFHIARNVNRHNARDSCYLCCIDYYYDRDSENKRPFYYVQSYNVHKLLVKAGAIDTRERDVNSSFLHLYLHLHLSLSLSLS